MMVFTEVVQCRYRWKWIIRAQNIAAAAESTLISFSVTVECQPDCIVTWALETDVLVLLLGHFSNMNCPSVWMKAGTSKKQRFIPVHERLTKPIVDVLIPFHALTGSDTTSFFAGHSKKTEWEVFEQHCNLLSELGLGSLTNEMKDAAESFDCKILWPV